MQKKERLAIVISMSVLSVVLMILSFSIGSTVKTEKFEKDIYESLILTNKTSIEELEGKLKFKFDTPENANFYIYEFNNENESLRINTIEEKISTIKLTFNVNNFQKYDKYLESLISIYLPSSNTESLKNSIKECIATKSENLYAINTKDDTTIAYNVDNGKYVNIYFYNSNAKVNLLAGY